ADRAEQPRHDRAEDDDTQPAPRRQRADRGEQPQPRADDRAPHAETAEKDVLAVQDDADEAGLVPTPEADAAVKPRRRRSPRRAARAEADADAQPAAAAVDAGTDDGVRRTAERGRRRAKPAEASSDDAAPAPERSETTAN
ncbi:MAG: hypothetical protein ACI807_003817, partial [Paracoccaceae bacterium]